MKRAIGWVCFAVLATSSASCSRSAEPSDRFVTDQEFRSQVNSAARSVGIGATDASGADLAYVHVLLLRDCLRDKGISIGDPPPPSAEVRLLPEVDAAQLWLSAGEVFGYGAALSDPQTVQMLREPAEDGSGGGEPYPPDALPLIEGDPPELITEPLPGNDGGSVTIPVGGCFGAATSALYGVPAAHFERTRLALPKPYALLAEALADEGVERAQPEYESCMRSLEHDVETPEDLAEEMSDAVTNVVAGRLAPQELTALEERLAQDDRSCKSTSGLGTAVAEAFLEASEDALAGGEGARAEYTTMLEHAGQVANARLAG